MLLAAAILALAVPQSRLIAVGAGESLSVVQGGQAGPGPSVVLVPGLVGAGFAFRRLTPLLRQAGFQTLVVEPLGFGGSSRPATADYSLHAQAARLAAALDTLGVSAAYIVSHQVGSGIALRLARHRPDLVRGIVSLEGGAAEAAASPRFRQAMKLAPLVKLLGPDFVRLQLRRQLGEASADPAWVTPSVVEGYLAPAGRDPGNIVRVYGAMASALEPEPLAPGLSEIRCPVVLLIGGVLHSPVPSTAEIAVLAARLPAFTVDTVAGAGHFLQEEAPAAVAAAVVRMHAAAPDLVAGVPP
jgi:pimeloyl-ACP methyl ester carboxylesterase